MLTGIVFGLIVMGWIAFLVPSTLSHKGRLDSASPDVADQFASSARIVLAADSVDDSGADVSTPLMRRAARREARRLRRIAMRRRRFGTLVFFVLLLCGIVMPFVLPMSHWWTLVAAVTFVGWLGLCRFSVWSLERQLGGELADWACAENTVQIAVPDDDASERSIEITEEIKNTLGSLWDPIPVTPTTYVSRPLLPRSVRTIDLSAPVSSSELQMPVSVERAEFDEAEEDRPTAIGE